MSWDRTGQVIESLYIGKYKATGEVVYSRVKFGGEVVHYVRLSEELKVKDGFTKYLPSEVLPVREEFVTNVIKENC